MHKLKIGEGLKELTVRPIISNIGTATYETAKYLNTLLTLLTKSQYNILSKEDLIQKIKSENILKGFKMTSFDVKSLFTNLPLHQIIEIILPNVYKEKKIKTSFPKIHGISMYKRSSLYIYDRVVMGSPLGLLLANIFMTSLEEEVIPMLTPYLCD